MASLSRRLLLQVCARDSANHLPASGSIGRVETRVCQRSDQNGEARVSAFWNSLVFVLSLFAILSSRDHRRAKSMKAVPGRLIQQGQQRGFKVLHLLFRLSAGLGCVRGDQGT